MSGTSGTPDITHGTGLVLGQWGVLIRGPSGAGKSLLALELIETGSGGLPARLVADDRVELHRDGANIVMTTPAAIAGLIELRGRGVVSRDCVHQARLDLIVDLVDELVRMPEPADFESDFEGVRLARCPVPRRGVADPVHQRLLIGEALRALEARKSGEIQKTA